MFIHHERLPHLLQPRDYHCAAQFEAERRALFDAAWHPVATLDEVPADGSYVTVSLFDTPLILWNCGGEVRAFLNVCPHRFSRVTSQAHGCASRLKCQYHGWEYDATGATRHIPEAHGFKPLTRGQHHLMRFRVETCGRMIFVSLSERAPTLQELLGRGFEPLHDLFGGARTACPVISRTINANWKLVVENALESYHVESVHTRTFKANPAPGACRHEFDERSTTFETEAPPAGRWQRFGDAVTYRLLGLHQDQTYRHRILYPNLMAGQAGMFTWCHVARPLGATQTESRLWMFQEQGARHPAARCVSAVMWRAACRFTRIAMEEDAAAAEAVQQAVQAPHLSFPGCLSPREERVWHFQQHVCETTRPAAQDRTAA